VPLVRYTLFPLMSQTTQTKWSDAGPISDLQSSTKPLIRTITVEQIDGWRKSVSETLVYATKDKAGQLSVLSAVCPHLGCSVQWQEGKNSFVCPCHAAAFDADGARTGGPAPRGMDTLETKTQDGRLFVRYQYFRQLVPTKEVIG
jgi:Rieske Fe-S protein